MKKPKRGWYAMPGGKMERGESIKESVIREVKEETGLQIKEPKLQGAFTILVKNKEEIIQEWMMFTFFCSQFDGKLFKKSDEGELEWVPVSEVLNKPMAEGDRSIYKHILENDQMIYGTFTYTEDYHLLNVRLDPPSDSKP
ncbi:8-oxo-dGTP diphosphatase [Aquibacillus sp. 3ASR75-54]|uniref:8-oxo-dGTP diphosphatase n=1 Tax=Aquibacillus salsiterrae TaxID=2950439 RepID=A0A9X3WCL5_9BACI|nr:8-oxo-dGTP diphosphatase [Aquibacillus salsiterrae]